MSVTFKDSPRGSGYKEAYRHAATETARLGVAHGIEATKEYGLPILRVFMLPAARCRQGFETRCEAVEIGSPII